MMESKDVLDRLIRKSRADLYKPIGIAEVLYRHRVESLDLSHLDDYRRKSYEWMREIVYRLHKKTTTLNSRYWDQLFTKDVFPLHLLQELALFNEKNNALVECYIYSHVWGKFKGIASLRQRLETISPKDFCLDSFLKNFEYEAKFRGSVDKAYEILVYALFSAIVAALQATVTLSVSDTPVTRKILLDFEDFASLVLGVDSDHICITRPARLFRVGTTNANDAGLDMWANFGPAVQVKHLTLSAYQVMDICHGVAADQLIIVCKSIEAQAIESLLLQLGFSSRIRGMITEKDLKRWYSICFKEHYCNTIGGTIIRLILQEMRLEFPLSERQSFMDFFNERAYNDSLLVGIWDIHHSDGN